MIKIGREDRSAPEAIVEKMMECTKEKSRVRAPIYDLRGNFYWPKK